MSHHGALVEAEPLVEGDQIVEEEVRCGGGDLDRADPCSILVVEAQTLHGQSRGWTQAHHGYGAVDIAHRDMPSQGQATADLEAPIQETVAYGNRCQGEQDRQAGGEEQEERCPRCPLLRQLLFQDGRTDTDRRSIDHDESDDDNRHGHGVDAGAIGSHGSGWLRQEHPR